MLCAGESKENNHIFKITFSAIGRLRLRVNPLAGGVRWLRCGMAITRRFCLRSVVGWPAYICFTASITMTPAKVEKAREPSVSNAGAAECIIRDRVGGMYRAR